SSLFFLLLIPPPPISTLFPYTTLFRSVEFPIHLAVLIDRLKRDVLRIRKVVAFFPEVFLALREFLDDLVHRHGRRLIGDVRRSRSEEHTSELQSRENLVCRLLLEKKK